MKEIHLFGQYFFQDNEIFKLAMDYAVGLRATQTHIVET